MEETIEDYKKKVHVLEQLLAKYEQNGPAKLYYSLNRKAWEMADLMNATNLLILDIDDPKSKTFDRLKAIWQDASSVAIAVKTLGELVGATGDEKKDTNRSVSFLDKNIS